MIHAMTPVVQVGTKRRQPQTLMQAAGIGDFRFYFFWSVLSNFRIRLQDSAQVVLA